MIPPSLFLNDIDFLLIDYLVGGQVAPDLIIRGRFSRLVRKIARMNPSPVAMLGAVAAREYASGCYPHFLEGPLKDNSFWTICLE
jgi:hypothetical protein